MTLDSQEIVSRPMPMPTSADRPIDQFGRIETRGIDHIPTAERHGRPFEVFSVWLAANVAYVYILLGGLLIVLGLSVWQAFAVLAVGNLFWILVGLLAVSGPASGTPSEVVTRSMFGVRGNRVFGAGVSWVVCLAYEGINLAIGSLAGFALAEYCGITVSVPLKVGIAATIGIATFAISLYGHATIVRFSVLFTVLFGAIVLLLGIFVGGHATVHPASYVPLHGGALWAALMIGVTVIASGPLSWGNGADYARYLPAESSPRAVALWTALGGWIPAMVLGGIGILAGTVVDMNDPQSAMRGILPSWFYGAFLVVLVLGSITNNVLTAYSSGLALQSLGVKMSRARTIYIDAILGGGLCAYALIASDFLTTMDNLLALTVTFLGPSVTIYAADILMRRNRYDGVALHDEEPGSPFWYRGGFNWAGVSALLLGTGAAMLCVNTTLVVGPISTALGGADISVLVGPVVAALLYLAVSRTRLVTKS